jgi:hypothetical protein
VLNLSHPSPSQQGPGRARFSRGWASIGVGISAFPLRAFVSFVVSGFAFPIPAMSAITAICGRALRAHDLSAIG